MRVYETMRYRSVENIKPLSKIDAKEKPYETEFPDVLCRICGCRLGDHTMINKRIVDVNRWPLITEPRVFYSVIVREPKCPIEPKGKACIS